MGRPLRVLIVEDSESDAAMLVRELKRVYELVHQRVETWDELASALMRQRWDLVLSDYAMPHFSAEGAARLLASATVDLPLIVISGAVGEEEAAGVMRAGARDFILKRNLRERLAPAIDREIDAAQTRRDKKSADKRLDFERHLLRQLMEGTPDAIFFKDQDHRYIHLNKGECQLLNVDAGEEVVGKTADALMPAERARRRREVEDKVLATGEPVVDSIESIAGKNGTSRWLSTTVTPIRGADGHAVGVVGIARDITESKRQEQLKNEFVATVSHELRTPLTSIMGAVGCVAGGIGGELSDSGQRLLKVAHANCQRLARIIDDILDLQKIAAGELVLEQKVVGIRELVERTVEATQSFADQHRVQMRMEQAQAGATVRADPHRLSQVITNLLSNAIKFSPSGGEVVVSTTVTPGAVRISVRDQGPGIPDDYKERIFDKFVQVDATDSRKKGGTGLGLAIAKQIMINLGGNIHVEDAPGGGSVFHATVARQLR